MKWESKYYNYLRIIDIAVKNGVETVGGVSFDISKE